MKNRFENETKTSRSRNMQKRDRRQETSKELKESRMARISSSRHYRSQREGWDLINQDGWDGISQEGWGLIDQEDWRD